MLSLQVTDIKDCMTKLLYKDCFDRFSLVEASIRMGISWHVDGHRNPEFYDSDPDAVQEGGFCLWQEAKPYIFQIIKGKRQPLGFKIILAFPDKTVDYLIQECGVSFRREDVEGIYLNLLFEPGNLRITTGISWRTFIMDRSLDQCVDNHVKAFLKSREIC